MCTCIDACICKVGQVQKARLGSPWPQQAHGSDTQNLQVLGVPGDLRGHRTSEAEELCCTSLSPQLHSSSMGDGAGPDCDWVRHSTSWCISNKSESSQPKMWCFEPKKPKSLWAKMCIQRQQTPHLHFMGNLSYIQRSNCIPEIHTLRNAWQNIAVLPNHESELPNVMKWAKMELTATHGECNPTYKIQHREEI